MNSMQQLARELVRVTEIKCQYDSLARNPTINVAPVQVMIEQSIERAILAIGTGEANDVIWSIRELEGFTG